MTILRDATAINDGTTAIMAVSLRNHGDNGVATAEPLRSWRCHCGLCRTSTAVVPRLRCDGGSRSAVMTIYTRTCPRFETAPDGFRTQDLSIERRLTCLSQPPRPISPIINATVTIMTMDILLEKYKTLMNYCLHRPTVVHTSPAGVSHHFINTYVHLYFFMTK